MTRYPLPADTRAALQHFAGRRKLSDRCRNPGLLFERYPPDLRDKKAKKEVLEAISRCKPDRRALDAYRHRLRAVVAAADATTFQAKSDWRFVTGLGRNTPFEVGFTFHRLYGFPIIPGSSLKGLARAWAYFRLKEAHPERDPEEDPLFAAVFGRASKSDEDKGSVGGAVFFESVPLDDPALELDVMTPHFPDYYAGKRPPTDNQDPVPIPFLTVKPGVRFGFAVGWRGKPNPDAHAQAVEWLKAGLEHLGAGAKTAAGYGYMKVL
jgi:CRISPR-associated protein Cmr6